LEEERRKEEEKKVALDIASFPSLISISSKFVLETKMSFITKITKITEITENKEQNVKEKVVPIGWCEFKLNKETNKINIKRSSIQKQIFKPKQLYLDYKVFERLVCLHEKRSNEYIEKWGYNEWVHTFQFPNYDYHYFDKLDEVYEKNNEYEYEDSEEEYEDQYWRKY
jgi:hypothetical protein